MLKMDINRFAKIAASAIDAAGETIADVAADDRRMSQSANALAAASGLTGALILANAIYGGGPRSSDIGYGALGGGLVGASLGGSLGYHLPKFFSAAIGKKTLRNRRDTLGLQAALGTTGALLGGITGTLAGVNAV